MQIRIGLDPLDPERRPTYAAMGNFDGVHRGHRALLGRLRDEARRDGVTSLVITFDPHPLQVLRPHQAPPLLTSVAERAYLMEGLGIDILQVIPFNREFAATSAEDYVRQVLVERLGVRRLYGGAYFRFGRNREGSADLIRRLAPETGCQVVTVEPLPWQQGAISSTLIRRLVAAGRVDEAAHLLTQPYIITGRVVRGPGRGRRLGIPTANIDLPPGRARPAKGVYAVRVCVDGAVIPGVANVGTRPTFTPAAETPILEVHLLDWEGDLYDKEIRVAFIRRLRDEMRFPGAQALLDQVARDVAAAKEALAAAPPADEKYLCLFP
ncbi:MAG TPA: bifunctional riboflavin kinase/FAD synthetase [Sphingobacteriaceae bacterium]|nr:bifunctional riboflavin kinase/FAD synthetase [Sphingobacteriaceae bacterium]